MNSQGCVVKDVYIHQDNKSGILLEKNGMKSVGKRTRHVDIKYLFVSDEVKWKNVTIVHCLTEDMVTDFYTKALKGKIFTTHRNAILGINEEYTPLYLKEYTAFIQSIDIE